MTDISALIETLDATARGYWDGSEYHLQAQTLTTALQVVELSTSRVYDLGDCVSVYVKDSSITEEDLINRTDIEYWAVMIPKRDSLIGSLNAVLDAVKGTPPKPAYQMGYHRANDTVDNVCEVDSIMAVIDTLATNAKDTHTHDSPQISESRRHDRYSKPSSRF